MSGFYSTQKVKHFNVVPGGNKALFNDSTRFGTKMLEKMGWTKGKGLGANLDGGTDFVRIHHKDNNKGVGFNERDDQWTQHEQNFNALLKSFETADEKAAAAAAADDDADEPAASGQGFGFQSAKPSAAGELITKQSATSGVSLEEQSKKSTKRVHYKKFTRGKDMSRYSEQDLANIFGKKALNDQHTFVAAAAVVASEEEEEADEKTHGVTVFKSNISTTDYFKQKMEALRAKRQGPNGEGGSNPFYVYQPEKVTLDFRPTENGEAKVEAEVVHKKEKKSKKEKKLSAAAVEETVIEATAAADTEDVVPKKKKKSKKSKRDGDEARAPEAPVELAETSADKIDIDFVSTKLPVVHDPENENAEIPCIVSPVKQKRQKKRKHDADEQQEHSSRAVLTEEPVNVAAAAAAGADAKPKKSKKQKRQRGEDNTENTAVAEVEEEEKEVATDEADAPPKKKKKKNKKQSKAGVAVITQPLHFPKFISNVLTSLYDPNVADDASDGLDNVVATATASASAAPQSANTSTTTANATVASTALQDTFELAKYKAELFRFFDLSGFAGSTLEDIAGYGYGRNLQLKVVTSYRDDQRITNFWDQALVNKYGADAIRIKKVAKKKKYNVKVLQKKNVFKF